MKTVGRVVPLRAARLWASRAMIPDLPQDVVAVVVAQLVAVTIKFAASDQELMTWIAALVHSSCLNKIFHQAASTKLQPGCAFWKDLCTARWKNAVPPTNNLRTHFLKRWKLEVHRPPPKTDWREGMHLLIEVYWESNAVNRPSMGGVAGAPRRWPSADASTSHVPDIGRSVLFSSSLALCDAAVCEVDGIPANATWYIPGLHYEPGDEDRDDCHLALGSCILWRGDDKMVELWSRAQRVSRPNPPGFDGGHIDAKFASFEDGRTSFMANARHNGHTCLQTGGSCHFEFSSVDAGDLGWLMHEVHQGDGHPGQGLRVEADIEVEIPSATHREHARYDESDGSTWGTEICLTFCAEQNHEASEQNFVDVEAWPKFLGLLPWE